MALANITILGSGTCAATRERSMASYHLSFAGRQALLDIGAGALRRLLEAGLSYREIDAIFITHHHIDHIADLVPFLWATRYSPEFNRTQILEIYGPSGTEAWYNALALGFGAWMQELPFEIQFHEGQETAWEWSGVKVTTSPMRHSVPVNGYRFEFGQKTLVYTGDTGFHENVIRLAEGADVLLIECSFPDREQPLDIHLTPSQVGKIATAAGARHVVLTHLYPECEAVDIVAQCRRFFSGPVDVARDLQKVSI